MLGQRAEWVRAARQAREALEALVKADPGSLRYRRDLASAYRLLATALPPGDGLALARRGHEMVVRLCDLEPGSVLLQGELAASHRVLGRIYRDTGRKAESQAEHEKALAVLQGVARRSPEMTDLQSDLARCHFDLAHARWEAGDLARAHASFTAARDIRQALVHANPQNVKYRTDLGVTLINMSGVLAELGRKGESLEAARQSIREHQAVFAAVPQIPRYRATLTHALKGLASFALKNNRPAEAAGTALELKKLWPANGRELYEAARILGSCAAVAGAQSVPPSGPAEAERYAGLAVATLREAAAAGLPQGARRATNPLSLACGGEAISRTSWPGWPRRSGKEKFGPEAVHRPPPGVHQGRTSPPASRARSG
jgi:tetratricopeptide (TPR) repeat protein